MAIPDAAYVRAVSNVDFGALNYSDNLKLERLVRIAAAQVGRYTGQRWVNGLFAPHAPLSTDDEVLVEDAIVQLTEWLAMRKQSDVIETMADFDLISSFSAGSYSETRRGGKDSVDAQRAFLRGLFWPLMDDDARDEWIAVETGVNPPAFAVTEVDWSGRSFGPEGPAGGELTRSENTEPSFESWNPYHDPRWS
jgi:hypothetical protein